MEMGPEGNETMLLPWETITVEGPRPWIWIRSPWSAEWIISEHWDNRLGEIQPSPIENNPMGSIYYCSGSPELCSRHREVEPLVSAFWELLVYGERKSTRKQLDSYPRQRKIQHQGKSASWVGSIQA